MMLTSVVIFPVLTGDAAPLGGAGKIMQWGKQPVDLQAQFFYNVETPNPLVGQGINIDNEGSTWTLRVQLKFLFPKGR